MPFNQCFRLVPVKFLREDKNVIIIKVKLFLRSITWKFLVDFKANKLSQLDYFLIYGPLKRGYFCSVDLKMGGGIHLQCKRGVRLQEIQNAEF